MYHQLSTSLLLLLQRCLRVKEALLLQVLDILQELVADAANAQAYSHASASVSAAAGASAQKQSSEEESLLWLAIASSVQQREQEINALYGGLLSSLYPSQRQHDALNMIKLLCSPDSIPQVGLCMPKMRCLTEAAHQCWRQLPIFLAGLSRVQYYVQPRMQCIMQPTQHIMHRKIQARAHQVMK